MASNSPSFRLLRKMPKFYNAIARYALLRDALRAIGRWLTKTPPVSLVSLATGRVE